jgi:hypothetical protein
MPWRLRFDKMAKAGLPIAAVDKRGRALALANWEAHLVGAESLLKGHGWVEMAHPDDLDAIFAWFAEDKDSGPMTHRGMWRMGDSVAIVLVGCAKVWRSGVWLVVYKLDSMPTRHEQEQQCLCRLDPTARCSDCGVCGEFVL